MNVKKFKRGWVGGKTELIVSSQYGVYRKLSIYGDQVRKHCGIDLAIPVGTTIYSPISGTCKCKFQKNDAGLYLEIISDGLKYMFFHLSETFIAKNMSSVVVEGQFIGKTGGKRGDVNSGNSTGPHLHFEIRKSPYNKGSDINPTNFFSDKLTSRNKQITYNSGDDEIPLISDISTNVETFVEVDEDKEIDSDSPDMSEADAIEADNTQNEESKTELASGIWQITKLLVDKEVAGLRMYDVATSIHIGSLISFFQKICQKPLVEFMGDTFGDQYYFIARKPPFDKEGMLNALVNQGLFDESGKLLNSTNNPYIIELKDVINTNLSFNNHNIYSWYQFYPVYELGMSIDNNYNFLVPAVLFPEYAAIYGSREFITMSRYRNFHKFVKDELNADNNSSQGNYETMNIIHDLKYIIESNAYNPFVRTGTIQIRGNRNIKRGMFILFNNVSNGNYLNEVFYVDSVSHDYSITSSGVNRTTNIGVSHGMLVDYMFEVHNIDLGDSQVKLSYFDLINFGNYKKDDIDINSWQNIISTWKVNSDVFLFFLRKLQFINGISPELIISSSGNNLFGF